MGLVVLDVWWVFYDMCLVVLLVFAFVGVVFFFEEVFFCGYF